MTAKGIRDPPSVLKDQVPAHLPRNARVTQAVDVGAPKRASDAYSPRLFGPYLESLITCLATYRPSLATMRFTSLRRQSITLGRNTVTFRRLSAVF